ncbi:DUF742 domain-containing protein [Actinophytocola glycyrrhizae]|uniref:DUF742 domain-containing protein n=1 Tax=Actinophytocola glycyrrhizae TaxID=2044873 RepID=A0ABV9SCD4_9PSEU
MYYGGWGSYQEWEAHEFLPKPPGPEGAVSGTLPPPTPAVLPIGPRSVVPAGRRSLGRREKKSKKLLPLAPPPTPAPDLVSPLAETGPWAGPKEAAPLSMEASHPKQLVRPYTRTGGRTHVQYRLELETLLSTALSRGRDRAALRDDLRAIYDLCRTPHSTAEVSAHLGLPLGAARVLIADVVDLGLLHVHETAADKPPLDLLYRVAAGLKNL